MRKIVFVILVLLLKISVGNSQIFEVDTLQYTGDINKYINIVIMGDGYTSSEQNNFISDANNLSGYLLTQVPWINYSNYFNVFAIKIVSPQSGTKHPNTASDCNTASPLVPVSNPSTYLGCCFDSYGIHRLVVPQNTSNVVSVLANDFPQYDIVLIIANTPYYGGSGGTYATSTIEKSSPEITAHEIGHSFAYLADEYYAGDIYDAEKPNMTQESNPSLIKWKNWIGYKGVGIYQYCCGGSSALWYKPGNNICKMQALGLPYCSVCMQAIIESIHSLANPIVSYTPATSTISSPNQYLNFKLTELMKPFPNTLNIIWKLDANVFSNNIDSIQIDQSILAKGTHTLIVGVTDTTSFLRVDNHSTIHISTVTWTINKTITGLDLKTVDNKITCSIYPNPSGNIMNISIDLEKKSNVSIELVSVDGKIIQHVTDKTLDKGNYLNTINIENLVNGTYFVVFKIDNFSHTETMIKQ